jgi:hypothetical protein
MTNNFCQGSFYKKPKGISVDLLEVSTQSFIIKIWIEETAAEAGRVVWRGHITHAASGQRRYFENLDDILPFLHPYLREMGIDYEAERPFKAWWQRWKLFLQNR